MQTDRTYRRGPVVVTRHYVDWEHGDGDTFAKDTSARILDMPSDLYFAYFNPAFTVKASKEVPEEVFLAEANRACILWNKAIAKVLGNGPKRRIAKTAYKRGLVYAFSGFLVLHGKVVHTKQLARFRSKVKS